MLLLFHHVSFGSLGSLFYTIQLSKKSVGPNKAISTELLLLIVCSVVDKVFGEIVGMKANESLHIASSSYSCKELVAAAPKLNIFSEMPVLSMKGRVKRW
jgi:hypothetical protein